MNGLLEKAKSQFAHDATVLAGIENGSVQVIPLTQGQVAVIDSSDVVYVVGNKWHIRKGRYTLYAARWISVGGRATPLHLHRAILGLKYGDKKMVDHKNQNGLDNRRVNLRITTAAINNYNCRMRKTNKSGFRGVCWKERYQKWHAQISFGGKVLHCGYFYTAEEAARAYDSNSEKLWGDNAFLNFPKES
jgi:hypothetical protein